MSLRTDRVDVRPGRLEDSKDAVVCRLRAREAESGSRIAGDLPTVPVEELHGRLVASQTLRAPHLQQRRSMTGRAANMESAPGNARRQRSSYEVSAMKSLIRWESVARSGGPAGRSTAQSRSCRPIRSSTRRLPYRARANVDPAAFASASIGMH